MSDTANQEIREAIKKKRLRHYEVADVLGVSKETLCIWLRKELPKEKKEKILKAINEYQF